MICIHNGILLSHKKAEWNNAICSNLGRPRDYYAKLEVSQTETDKYMISLACGM